MYLDRPIIWLSFSTLHFRQKWQDGPGDFVHKKFTEHSLNVFQMNRPIHCWMPTGYIVATEYTNMKNVSSSFKMCQVWTPSLFCWLKGGQLVSLTIVKIKKGLRDYKCTNIYAFSWTIVNIVIFISQWEKIATDKILMSTCYVLLYSCKRLHDYNPLITDISSIRYVLWLWTHIF